MNKKQHIILNLILMILVSDHHIQYFISQIKTLFRNISMEFSNFFLKLVLNYPFWNHKYVFHLT